MDLEVLGHRSRDFQPVGKERSWIKAGGALQVRGLMRTLSSSSVKTRARIIDFLQIGNAEAMHDLYFPTH